MLYIAWGGTVDCYLKPIFCMEKRVTRYVCCVPALTTTKPFFLTTDMLKLNDVYNLQICKLMGNTEFGVDQG